MNKDFQIQLFIFIIGLQVIKVYKNLFFIEEILEKLEKEQNIAENYWHY